MLNVVLASVIVHLLLAVEPLPSIDFEKLSQARIERILNASPDTVNIVMLGNSITEMGGDWNAKLNRNDVRNSGQGGYTTGQMIWYLDAVVIDAGPKYCFTLGGVNDLSCGIPVNQIMENYRVILKKLTDAGIQPVVQSTLYQTGNTEGNKKIDRVNDFLQNYCNTHQIDYINLNQYLSDENGLISQYTRDGTHLTEEGYTVWVNIVKAFFEKHHI